MKLEIRGVEQLAKLTKELRELGDKRLRSEFFRGINRATKVTRKKLRASARGGKIPRAGGLADRVAKSKIVTKRRGGRNAGISIVASSGYDIRSMDRGRLRKPVFQQEGREPVWVNQTIPAGWWTEPLQEDRDAMVREVQALMDDIGNQVEKKKF